MPSAEGRLAKVATLGRAALPAAILAVLARASLEFLIEVGRRHTRVEPAPGLGQLVSNDLLELGAVVSHDLPSVDEEGGDAWEAHAGGEVDVGVDCGPMGAPSSAACTASGSSPSARAC